MKKLKDLLFETSRISEQQISRLQILKQHKAIMEETRSKLMALPGTDDADVDETIQSVAAAVCESYIVFCDNMIALATDPTMPLVDLPWGTEIQSMLSRIEEAVVY